MKSIQSIKYVVFLVFLLVGVAVVLLSVSVRKPEDNPIGGGNPPNIVVILADDAGYADFGFMGSEDIKTPHLDELAKDGTVFTDAHVSASVCSPSRAGLLTGKYQQRFGHECNLEPDQSGAFDTAQVTIAEFLQNQGYQTSIFGKWHLGEQEHQHPLKNGFDHFWGFLAGGRSYFPDDQQDKAGNKHAILNDYEPTSFKGYLTDAIGDQAKAYIRNREIERPFFMYLSFNAPHTPMHAKPEVVATFGEDHQRPVYAAMLWSLDEAVGQLIKELKHQKIYDNTLIFFLSDNGGAHNNNSSVKPFKGWKGNQFEGGTRVPFTVTWPDKVPKGKQFHGLTSSLDIYGTVKALFKEPKGIKAELDGVNLFSYLSGTKQGSPHQKLFWRKDEMATVRFDSYKLITLKDSISVMYDLNRDLIEENDLTSQEIDKSSLLHKELADWEKELDQPLWLEPEKWNVVTRKIYTDLMQNNPPLVKEPGDLKELGIRN